MNLIPLHPHPDPEISSVVGQLTARLAALGAAPGALIASLVGSSPGPAADDEFPSHDAEALYQMAAHLCNEGDFARALPIALYLTMGRERKPHHVFMAASCLQRLAAMGRTQEAIQAFESAIELARDDAAYMHLQAIAEKKAQQLRSGR
jgi:tetratricopeptide (TPR) repeat protein